MMTSHISGCHNNSTCVEDLLELDQEPSRAQYPGVGVVEGYSYSSEL